MQLPACIKARLPLLAAALWWGALTAIGGIVMPLFYMHAAGAAMAVPLAASVMTASMWLSVACGFTVVLAIRPSAEEAGHAWAGRALTTTGWALAALLAALLLEFAVVPRILMRENLSSLLGAGAAVYALQWLCCAVVLWRLSTSKDAQGRPHASSCD
ncbi:hypothetical protein AAV94_02995 [Lampropedia cohaerens]|uniref:DUF4149 domain-containing protein n=1 Tax=Lampropedia cohaerens TaxID=1610491 RepID=A0A0U1Q2C0_9BURK|nr:DUF4149 domain-containing protein [Lampropedia cohaerens]KKW68901.1 hypothetical protein AAV94_02995 [Lampropedia cohaerens]